MRSVSPDGSSHRSVRIHEANHARFTLYTYMGCIGRKSPSVAEQPSASPDGPRVVSIKQGERLALSVGISNMMVWGERAKC